MHKLVECEHQRSNICQLVYFATTEGDVDGFMYIAHYFSSPSHPAFLILLAGAGIDWISSNSWLSSITMNQRRRVGLPIDYGL